MFTRTGFAMYLMDAADWLRSEMSDQSGIV
jgi:hypothetical protein